jgi:hypothetical protein
MLRSTLLMVGAAAVVAAQVSWIVCFGESGWRKERVNVQAYFAAVSGLAWSASDASSSSSGLISGL